MSMLVVPTKRKFSSFLKIMAALTIGVGCLFSTSTAPVQAESVAKAKDATNTKFYWESADFSGGTHEGTVGTDNSLTLNSSALLGGVDTTAKYNGSTYFYGQYTTPVITGNFTEAIASWQANTQPGTWTEVELSANVGGVWTKWYSMGVWLEGDLPFKRHSVSGQGDTYGTVYTDTLSITKGASAVKARVTLFTTDGSKTPTMRSLGITFSNGTDNAGAVPFSGLTSDLAVPKRSQMVFPDGGEVWCSPTSTSMVMAYWANVTGNQSLNVPVPTVVKGVWDYRYNGAGNWPYNTAYASSFGLQAKVVRMSSLAEVEQWTKAGVPVIASIAYKKDALTGSPIPSTAGHLLVIRGFDAQGNVLTNDPAAASDEAVGITYKRVELEKAWLDNSNGTVYLMYPAGWTTPVSDKGHW